MKQFINEDFIGFWAIAMIAYFILAVFGAAFGAAKELVYVFTGFGIACFIATIASMFNN